MSVERRNAAFREATLHPDDPDWFRMERLLRRRIGLPRAGLAVYAVSDGGVCFRPELGPNASIRDSECRDEWTMEPADQTRGPKDAYKPNVLVWICAASICQSDRRVLRGEKRHHS